MNTFKSLDYFVNKRIFAEIATMIGILSAALNFEEFTQIMVTVTSVFIGADSQKRVCR